MIENDDFRELCKFLHLHLAREARVFFAGASSTGGIDRNEFAARQIIAHRVVAQVLERLRISPEYLVFFLGVQSQAYYFLLYFRAFFVRRNRHRRGRQLDDTCRRRGL